MCILGVDVNKPAKETNNFINNIVKNIVNYCNNLQDVCIINLNSSPNEKELVEIIFTYDLANLLYVNLKNIKNFCCVTSLRKYSDYHYSDEQRAIIDDKLRQYPFNIEHNEIRGYGHGYGYRTGVNDNKYTFTLQLKPNNHKFNIYL